MEGPNLNIELGGLVVKPEEVLVVVLPENVAPGVGEQVREVLDGVGLSGRSVVIRGDVKLATLSR